MKEPEIENNKNYLSDKDLLNTFKINYLNALQSNYDLEPTFIYMLFITGSPHLKKEATKITTELDNKFKKLKGFK